MYYYYTYPNRFLKEPKCFSLKNIKHFNTVDFTNTILYKITLPPKMISVNLGRIR